MIRTKTTLSAAMLAAFLAGEPAAAQDRLTIASTPTEDLKSVFAVVESVRQANARARIAGTLADLAVREGDRVDAGQVLARVRDPKLPLQITATDARLASLEAQRRQAETELERARALRVSGSASQQRLDDAQTGLDVLIAQIAAMRADRAVVEQQMREGDVLAPAAGRVLKVPVVSGGVIQPGEAVATLATDTYVLRLSLPERHARFMHVGDPVLVGARGLADPAAADKLTRGTIRLVYPELSNGQVIADAEVANLGDYFVGERVRVLVSSGLRTTVIVPPSFLTRRAGVDFAALADGPLIPVQAGRAVPSLDGRPGGVEILSGLKAGDVIVAPKVTP